ncbi:chemotaxis protein CheW [Halioxenophilus sp. WMMB6]|uniref:chemotaxis protein CheW n=1 Tax=Halioxenophilus sp. WMMB6 TaxID=3073815 RepID=UPI00295E7B83|nr:chemotaxis protein CheW [Halioxenophilus sp. WMMB6]
MNLTAWQVSCDGYSVLLAESALVEYVAAPQLFSLPGNEGLWSAVIDYNQKWLPVLCWSRRQEAAQEVKSLVVLQVSALAGDKPIHRQRIAVCVDAAPTKQTFSDQQFTDDINQVPQLWREISLSCIEACGQTLPIINPTKLLTL